MKKEEKKVTMSFSLSKEALEKLTRIAGAELRSRSKMLELIIRNIKEDYSDKN